jgi:hypothetical protein
VSMRQHICEYEATFLKKFLFINILVNVSMRQHFEFFESQKRLEYQIFRRNFSKISEPIRILE